MGVTGGVGGKRQQVRGFPYLKAYQAARAENTKASAANRSPGLFFAPWDAGPSFARDKVPARRQPELTVPEYGGHNRRTAGTGMAKNDRQGQAWWGCE